MYDKAQKSSVAMSEMVEKMVEAQSEQQALEEVAFMVSICEDTPRDQGYAKALEILSSWADRKRDVDYLPISLAK